MGESQLETFFDPDRDKSVSTCSLRWSAKSFFSVGGDDNDDDDDDDDDDVDDAMTVDHYDALWKVERSAQRSLNACLELCSF